MGNCIGRANATSSGTSGTNRSVRQPDSCHVGRTQDRRDQGGPLAGLSSRNRATTSRTNEQVQEQAAHVIGRHVRAHIARPAYQGMQAGIVFSVAPGLLRKAGLLGPKEALTVDKLSSINISRLRKRLGKLNQGEVDFFDRFTRQQFFATHFTDAKLDHPSSSVSTMALFSRSKLDQRGISFNQDNTTHTDRHIKGDQDFVFFSLECGEEPQKLSSRFGKTLYRVPFDAPVFRQVAWGTLDDIIVDVDEHKNIDRYIPGLNEAERDVIRKEIGYGRNWRDYLNDSEALNDVFSGADFIAGAAFSLISKLRTVNEKLSSLPSSKSEPTAARPLAESLLDSDSAQSMNALLSVFHRPEIRVPVHFFSSNFEKFTGDELEQMK